MLGPGSRCLDGPAAVHAVLRAVSRCLCPWDPALRYRRFRDWMCVHVVTVFDGLSGCARIKFVEVALTETVGIRMKRHLSGGGDVGEGEEFGGVGVGRWYDAHLGVGSLTRAG